MIDQILLFYALSFLGTSYKWGGKSYDGIDCSGFVLELMQSIGAVPHGMDMTAQEIFNYFDSKHSIYCASPQSGSLVFYGQSVTKITHVAFALDPYRVIEAGGGGRDTQSKDDAAEAGAFVRIRPIDYRKDRVSSLKIDYAVIGRLF